VAGNECEEMHEASPHCENRDIDASFVVPDEWFNISQLQLLSISTLSHMYKAHDKLEDYMPKNCCNFQHICVESQSLVMRVPTLTVS
jgi:hypothetical protein